MAIEEHPFTTNRWFEKLNDVGYQEKWFINRNEVNEVVSFSYMPSMNVSSIFLGSFPIWEIVTGPLNNNMEFFYGSAKNEFWEVLGKISGLPFDNLKNCLMILDVLNLGLTDILLKVRRQPENCSQDKCLENLKYNDILDLKKHFPSINNIFITSGGKGQVPHLNQNNKSVATWFKNSVNTKRINGFQDKGFIKTITVGNDIFNLIYLFSPSGNANRNLQGTLNKYNNFNDPSININNFRKVQWGYFIRKYHVEGSATIKLNQILDYVNENLELKGYFDN